MSTIYEGDDLKVKAETLVAHVIDCFDDAKAGRSEWESNKDKSHSAYHGLLPAKTRPWKDCANLHVPLTPITTDTFHANLMGSFFSGSDLVKVNPVSADDMKTARKREQFLNYQLQSECTLSGDGIRPIADKLFGMSLKYGDAIAHIRYERIVKQIKDQQVQEVPNAQGQIEVITDDIIRDEVVYDGILIDVPNIDDIFLAPGATGLQAADCEYVIRRVRLSRAQYDDLVENADYTKISHDKFNEEEDYSTDQLRRKDEKLVGVSRDLRDTNNYITLLQFYGEYLNSKTDKVQEIVAVIHPGSKTLCKAFVNPLPCRPLVKFTPMPVENQTYGVSIPEKLRYLQAELNTIHNQRRDSETKRICMPGFYDPGSDFDPTSITMEPNGMYPIRGGSNAIYFPPFQDAPSSLFNEEQLIFRYADQLTGASEPMQGVQSSGDITATEFAGVLGRSNVRFDLIYKRYETAFKELVQVIVLMDKQFMPNDKEYRVVGSDGRFKWESLKKQELAGRLDLIIIGRSVANEMQEKQAAITKYQFAMGNPLIVSDPVALYENTKEVFERLGTKDIDRKVPVPPQAKTRSPVEEHELLYRGRMVYPDPREDAQKHLADHLGETSQPEFDAAIDPMVKSMFMAHITMTQALAAAQMQMQQLGAMQNVGSSKMQPTQTAPVAGEGSGSLNTAEETKPAPQQNKPQQKQV